LELIMGEMAVQVAALPITVSLVQVHQDKGLMVALLRFGTLVMVVVVAVVQAVLAQMELTQTQEMVGLESRLQFQEPRSSMVVVVVAVDIVAEIVALVVMAEVEMHQLETVSQILVAVALAKITTAVLQAGAAARASS
jgi:hypothetical protein